MSTEEPAYERVLLKLSGEAQMGDLGFGVHVPTLQGIATPEPDELGEGAPTDLPRERTTRTKRPMRSRPQSKTETATQVPRIPPPKKRTPPSSASRHARPANTSTKRFAPPAKPAPAPSEPAATDDDAPPPPPRWRGPNLMSLSALC